MCQTKVAPSCSHNSTHNNLNGPLSSPASSKPEVINHVKAHMQREREREWMDLMFGNAQSGRVYSKDCSINSRMACTWRLIFKINKKHWLIIQSLNSLHQRAFAFLDAGSACLQLIPESARTLKYKWNRQTSKSKDRCHHNPDGLIWTDKLYGILVSEDKKNKLYNLRLCTFTHPQITPNAFRFSPSEEMPLADMGSPLTCVTQH